MLRRACACGTHASVDKCQACAEREKLSRRAVAGARAADRAPPVVSDVLHSPGAPLDPGARAFMEPLFGSDFAGVRVHTDATAAHSARAVDADAYTVGQHIVFAEGRYAPSTRSGGHLLAHELAHTLQQSGAPRSAEPPTIGQASDPAEGEADRAADAIASGAAWAAPFSPALGLQRQTPGTTRATAAADADTGPGPCDACGELRPALEQARVEAARLAGRALSLLAPENLAQAAPLAAAHFHLDVTREENQASLELVRGQFTRMQLGLSSGSRIICRSAPPPPGRASAYPADSECAPASGSVPPVASSTSCAANNPATIVKICAPMLEFSNGPLPKVLLHEFAHVACNGTPSITSRGSETYYPGDRLPGSTPNEIIQADSYAWFALAADRALGPEAGATTPASGDDHAGYGVLTGLGAALTIGGAIGLGYGISQNNSGGSGGVGIGLGVAGLALGGLGLGLGIAGLAGAFDRRRPEPPRPPDARVHLTGGRERTRQAFIAHFQGDTWICYWSAFEQGMAEIIARDSLTSGAEPSARNSEQNVQLMREVMTALGAERVRRAYLTGNPDSEIFEALRRGMPSHIDPTLPPVCHQPGALAATTQPPTSTVGQEPT